MFLREIHVDHFRAICRARLRLDTSTTLTGENGCGISSLIAAVQLVLGGADEPSITTADVHREIASGAPVGPVRARLVFEERTRGEWQNLWHAPLHPHLPAGSGKRRLALEASADPPPEGGRTTVRLHVPGVDDATANRAVVQHVRAVNPLLRLQGGALSGHHGTMSGEASRAGAAASEHLAELVARVLREADALLGGTVSHPESCLDAGAMAARELLALSPHHFDAVGSGLANPVLEILGVEAGSSLGRRARQHETGAIADRLGMLLVVAAILRHLPGGIRPGVEPLWIVEEPEAHLHPMTLVAVHRTLERIRWQKIVTTHSGDLLSAVPLAQLRRLIRHDGVVHVSALTPRALSREHLRRVGYHLRLHRGVAMFARVWLLVEGESEFWVLPQVAQVLGYDLALEGICCVGFAQCGIEPLVRTAMEFGIEWHLLADGDEAGRRYVEQARALVRRHEVGDRITGLDEPDIEHCFWEHGHSGIIAEAAGLPPGAERRVGARQTIAKAVKRRSKPFLALKLVESVAARGPAGVPAPLAGLIETCVRLAREAPRRAVGAERM